MTCFTSKQTKVESWVGLVQGSVRLSLSHTLLMFPSAITPYTVESTQWSTMGHENHCGERDGERVSQRARDISLSLSLSLSLSEPPPRPVSPLSPWTRCYGNRGSSQRGRGDPVAGCLAAGHSCSLGWEREREREGWECIRANEGRRAIHVFWIFTCIYWISFTNCEMWCVHVCVCVCVWDTHTYSTHHILLLRSDPLSPSWQPLQHRWPRWQPEGRVTHPRWVSQTPAAPWTASWTHHSSACSWGAGLGERPDTGPGSPSPICTWGLKYSISYTVCVCFGVFM